MIDLHIHSTFSDGSLTPDQLAETAGKERLTAVALTDHDTTQGVAAFLAACRGRSIIGIAGVEISAEFSPGTMHVLGYFVEGGQPAIEEPLARMREGRDDRNGAILRALQRLNCPIAMDQVLRYAGEDVVGRPHIAQAMVDAGYVASTKEAFDRYLGKGKPAYVDRFRLSPEASVRAIRSAGGVAVLAHPSTLDVDARELRRVAESLAGAGLQGLEAYYSEHTAQDTKRCLALARDLNLLVTGGSDFHGALSPEVKMGRGFGSLRVPDELLPGLFAAAGRTGPPAP